MTGPENRDESPDLTKGAHLNEAVVQLVVDRLTRMREWAAGTIAPLAESEVAVTPAQNAPALTQESESDQTDVVLKNEVSVVESAPEEDNDYRKAKERAKTKAWPKNAITA